MSITNCLSMPFPLTPETAAKQLELSAATDAHNASHATLADDENALKAVHESNWNSKCERDATKLRERKIALLGNEIALREKIDAYFDDIREVDHPAAVNAAHAEVEAAKADVTKKLVSIGYVNGPVAHNGNTQAMGITLSILNMHPRLREANTTLDGLHGYRAWQDLQGNNRKALGIAKETLSQVRQRGIALMAS